MRLAVAVFDGDLGLAIGTEEMDLLALADFREALREAMGQLDRHRHEFFGFIASVAEHQALVAGAAGIHAHGDVRRLALYRANHRAGVRIETVFRVVVADLAHGFAGQLIVIHMGRSRDFAGHDDQSSGQQGFARYASLRILPHYFIKDRIRNLVSNLIRVAFRDRLGSKQKIAHVSVAQNQSPLRLVFKWEG